MNWRLICDDGVTDSFGLAADEAVARRVVEGTSPPTLRLYTYRSHAALAGRFQTIEHEIHTAYCRDHTIAINRRPTGGGAILMGEDQLGIALAVPGRAQDTYHRARELMQVFSGGLAGGLRALGIEASFRRKNDLEVRGRKIAGLGMYRSLSGGLLFHASLLLDMNVPLMLQVLKTPFEKISDKEILTVEGRITTIAREMGRAITLDELRDVVAHGYACALQSTFGRGEFSSGEQAEIAELERSKYRNPDWVFQSMPLHEGVGTARVKTPAGLLDISVSLAGETLKAVHVRGDFFANENAVADVEASLRWQNVGSPSFRNLLRDVYLRHEQELSLLRAEDLESALLTAVRRAQLSGSRPSSDPYGCFVNPGGAHAIAS
jgi:lipoate-protein ligase A